MARAPSPAPGRVRSPDQLALYRTATWFSYPFDHPWRAVVTVLSSSWASGGFEDVVEREEEFSHDGGQSQFVWFTFGT
jgi:hypothetical protein